MLLALGTGVLLTLGLILILALSTHALLAAASLIWGAEGGAPGVP
jgi:hypothetical protein